MSEIKVASRYAKSLIDLAIEQNILDSIKGDMVLFDTVVDKNSELEAILKNPIIPLDKKSGILDDVFGDKVNQLTKIFFSTVVRKGRSSILYATAKQFIAQYNQIKGILTADISTAVALDAQTKQTIINLVKEETKANEVIVREFVNPDLIGGFILKVGDKQVDASIATKLNKMKKALVN